MALWFDFQASDLSEASSSAAAIMVVEVVACRTLGMFRVPRRWCASHDHTTAWTTLTKASEWWEYCSRSHLFAFSYLHTFDNTSGFVITLVFSLLNRCQIILCLTPSAWEPTVGNPSLLVGPLCIWWHDGVVSVGRTPSPGFNPSIHSSPVASLPISDEGSHLFGTECEGWLSLRKCTFHLTLFGLPV